MVCYLDSEEEVRQSLTSGRIVYLNRSLLEPNMKMTSSEDDRGLNALQKVPF